MLCITALMTVKTRRAHGSYRLPFWSCPSSCSSTTAILPAPARKPAPGFLCGPLPSLRHLRWSV